MNFLRDPAQSPLFTPQNAVPLIMSPSSRFT